MSNHLVGEVPAQLGIILPGMKVKMKAKEAILA